jgi:hypothetical protein
MINIIVCVTGHNSHERIKWIISKVKKVPKTGSFEGQVKWKEDARSQGTRPMEYDPPSLQVDSALLGSRLW